MDKNKALERIATLEDELAKLKKEVKKPEIKRWRAECNIFSFHVTINGSIEHNDEHLDDELDVYIYDII